jgi:hypothetical protein
MIHYERSGESRPVRAATAEFIDAGDLARTLDAE